MILYLCRYFLSEQMGKRDNPQKEYTQGLWQRMYNRRRILFVGDAKQQPKVSVIIPTYNRANLIGRAIRSILCQTYAEYEIIVVDDGSNDNTRDVVESFRDDRIQYIRHRENRGNGAALNTGIKVARCDYIAFQDSDDEWLSEKLEKQIFRLESANSEIGAVYTAMWRIESNSAFLVPQVAIKKKEGNIGHIILESCFIGMPTVLIHKRCFDRVGLFDENLFVAADWEMWIRVAQHYKFSLIEEPLVISRQQADSLTTDKFDWVRLRAFETTYEKHYEKFLKNRNAMRNICFQIGHHRCLLGDSRRGRKWLIKSFKWVPINIKRMILIVISFFGRDAYVVARRLKRELFKGRKLGPIYFFLFK